MYDLFVKNRRTVMNRGKMIYVLSEYCTGCGLCASILNVQTRIDTKGFLYPKLDEEHLSLCKKVCPAAGYALRNYSDGSILGKVLDVKLGWSNDEKIRHVASSGGIITSICVYLIQNKIVDGIIQTRKASDDVRKVETIVSRTVEDVLSCMGSRYTASSPLLNIKQLVEKGKKYAFVGKPCDVSALRMYKETTDEEWVKQITLMLSFFCAGQPSLAANDKLLKILGCDNCEGCDDLQYRGNGWPGFATARLKNGNENKVDYETAWMKVLGRDVRRSCRFCADGTGEYADISCGDAWYLTPDKKPDLTEHLGRNVIFARTKYGASLLNEVINAGIISVEDYDVDKDGLRCSQPYHYTRKASLSSLKLALLLCGRTFPYYDNGKLKIFAKELSFKGKLLRFIGTVQRIWNHKI